MKRQLFKAAAIVGAIILLLGAVKFFLIWRAMSANSAFAPPPEAVTSSVVKEEVWPREIYAVGTLSAEQGVTLSTQEAGVVARVNFESGSYVNAGDVLIELDTAVEEANLKTAVSVRDLARLQLGRSENLKGGRVISQAEVDKAGSDFRSAEAQVNAFRARIDRMKVVAPFAGRLGIREVNIGQHVAPGTPVWPLYDLDPLNVDFSVPQSAIADIKAGDQVNVSLEESRSAAFSGRVAAVDPQVDERTRNVRVRASIANPAESLRPGMFVHVRVVIAREDHFITVPASSINYAPYGDSIYVIEEMKDPAGNSYRGVRQQIIKMGDRRGDQVAVLAGLKSGEEVVTSGVFKLRPGAAVQVNNNFVPGSSANPEPADA